MQKKCIILAPLSSVHLDVLAAHKKIGWSAMQKKTAPALV